MIFSPAAMGTTAALWPMGMALRSVICPSSKGAAAPAGKSTVATATLSAAARRSKRPRKLTALVDIRILFSRKDHCRPGDEALQAAAMLLGRDIIRL